MSQFKSRLQIFHEENGEDCIAVGDWYIYSNGARRDINPEGVMFPPPTDQFERARLQVAYHERMVQKAINKLNERRDQLNQIVLAATKGNGHAPGDYELEEIEKELDALHQQVEKRRKPLAEAQAAVEVDPPEWYRRQQARAAEVAAQAAQAGKLSTLLNRFRV